MNRLLSILSAMAVCLYMSAQRHVVINKNDVNLRSEASTTAQVVKKAKKGTVLELVEASRDGLRPSHTKVTVRQCG